MEILSDRELAERYINKHKLLGLECKLDLKIDGDDVILVDVLDKEDTGRLVIPSFVTKIEGLQTVNEKL